MARNGGASRERILRLRDDLTFGAAGAFTGEMSTILPPFEEVVAEHGPTVLRVCRAVLGPVDAEDAWSETFLAALRAYPRPAARQQRRGLAGDDRPPQGHRPARAPGPAPAPGGRPPGTPRDERRPGPSRTAICGPPCRRCRPSSARPWPTTTSPACPTPRWRRSSAAVEAAARRSRRRRHRQPAQDLLGRERRDDDHDEPRDRS